MHYFLIAGEASGDLHASRLIKALKEKDAEARFTFIGGDKMAAEAGCKPIVHYSKTAFMGFSEVLRHLRQILRIMKETVGNIKQASPDALILVDYPGFNLKVAKKIKKLYAREKRSLPIFYYISPKVWAWKKWRVKTIRRYVDRLFSILPFEVSFFKGYGYDTDYVGNPSQEEVDNYLASPHPDRSEFLTAHKLRDRKLIAILPGSRLGEIKNNLPIMLKAVERFPQYVAVIARAPGVDREYYNQFSSTPLNFTDDTYNLLCHATAAFVTSGTATLEAALFGVPQVVCYRANGSKISYNIMKSILSVKHVSLPNLIVDKEIIPEMLVHLCTVDNIGDKMAEIIGENSAGRIKQLEGYKEMRERLTVSETQSAPELAAQHIVDALKQDVE